MDLKSEETNKSRFATVTSARRGVALTRSDWRKSLQPLSALTLSLPANGRIRLNSESHASTISRGEELLARGEEEAGTPTEGFSFRNRSNSAPPALWAAKKYGRQLRRMSDEFVNLLDKGVRMRIWIVLKQQIISVAPSLSSSIQFTHVKKYLRVKCGNCFMFLLCFGITQELRKVSSAGSNRPIPHSRSWWNYLFSHQETEGENSHHETHSHRTE
ncbi:hypothetical protein GOODEAATRI_016795 [Goodea atripinnis]|uniref:Uncharacterized protein n=1 Tax=Goodea atripinnis TaxID=208336 RepID=A0ABV0NYK8_9TELE